MIAFVFQPSRGGKRSKFYSAKLQLDGWPRVRIFALRTSDKGVAEEKLRKLRLDYEREALGILPPRAEREASRKPLPELVAAFLADLEGQGRARSTRRRYKRVLGAVLRLSGWKRLADISPASFASFRATCGRSPKWSNDALGVLSTWLNWLVRSEAMPRNTLADVTPARVIKAEHRRALSSDELQRLVSSAPRNRAAMYLILGYTGLRRDEVNHLIWGDFEGLDGPDPFIRLRPEITKNRKRDKIHLRPEVVQAVLSLRPDLAMPYEWAFKQKVPSPKKLREDLAAAGVPYMDDRGRRVDIHALRKTFITLGASVMSPQVLKTVARHADLRTTLDHYTDTDHLPIKAGMAALPAISLSGTHAQKHAQTPVISTCISVRAVAACHFLADFAESVSLSSTPTTGAPFTYCLDHKVVGVERFELSASTSRT